ncbi:hypothetical protein ABW19_dt0204186 [Dactylella cylindrospora]|nr:hypothetical protein ABW19_dt0204186 [Dactylella cylindrospora]
MRIPAWCDRILRKGSNVRQLTYNSAPLKFSDHRPVYATFEATISFVNEEIKEKLSQEIYASRRDAVGTKYSNHLLDDDESDDDLIGYDPIAPGLPPASSDMRKWWLDHGTPAKSTVKPPGDNYEINTSKRTGNPFTPTSEKDWVKKEAPAPPPARGTNSTPRPQPEQSSVLPPPDPPIGALRRQGTDSSVSSRGTQLRKLPPPYDPATLPPLGNQVLPPPLVKTRDIPPPLQPSRGTPTTSIATPTTPPFTATSRIPSQPLHRSPSISSIGSKAPPPKPKKPTSLAGASVDNTSPQSFKSVRESVDDERVLSVAARIRGVELAGDSGAPAKRTVSNPIPGSTSSTSSVSANRSLSTAAKRNGELENTDRPPLPQRKPTGNLMDEGDAGGLSGWKPLAPGK